MTPDPKLAYRYLDSPVGKLLVTRDGETIHHISFPTGKTKLEPALHWFFDEGGFERLAGQLEAYFAGELTEFDVPLHMIGTDFQKQVWQQLRNIPYGRTCSYGEIARQLGDINKSRAVGLANGANPLPIIIPCHRVIGADKSMTGFGGGVETKEFLLRLEGVLPEQPRLL
jgi:methylated-DNA-[protein]-cysteine S-methyltransferase